MKLVRTIVFILLFAVVMVIYLFQARFAKQALVIIPDEANQTVVISKNDPIDRMELRDPVQKTRIVLRKKNGVWAIEQPVRYPAENQIVEGFVIAARMASRQPRLRAEKEWREYGLAEPELEILFGLPGKRVVTLQIGAQAPVGKTVFARWAEERGFFLLPAEMKAMFCQSVYKLRKKQLFRAPADMIRKIYVEMGEYSYQWKKDGGKWYWLEPVEKFGQKVPVGRMDLVLEGLQSLHVREFRDNNKRSKAELGFFMIHDRIRVESEDGKQETFYFGNEVPEQNAYYGFLEGEDVIFFVDRAKVIEFFDLMQKIQTEDPEPEIKDLGPKTKDLTPKT
ncbi:MAG: DUF4340 domain-containing protein [Candidatus Omnitrophota bacterium]|jgi:hypothetical protein